MSAFFRAGLQFSISNKFGTHVHQDSEDGAPPLAGDFDRERERREEESLCGQSRGGTEGKVHPEVGREGPRQGGHRRPQDGDHEGRETTEGVGEDPGEIRTYLEKGRDHGENEACNLQNCNVARKSSVPFSCVANYCDECDLLYFADEPALFSGNCIALSLSLS